MRVRQAETADTVAMAHIVATVAEEGWIATEPPVDIDNWVKGVRHTLETPDNSAMWVLEESGTVLGQASALETQISGVFSLGMVILPEGRGRAGGRALLDAVIEHARECGAHKLELEVWPNNARAIALYVRAGFEVEGCRRDHYPRGDGSLRSALIMSMLFRDRASTK